MDRKGCGLKGTGSQDLLPSLFLLKRPYMVMHMLKLFRELFSFHEDIQLHIWFEILYACPRSR